MVGGRRYISSRKVSEAISSHPHHHILPSLKLCFLGLIIIVEFSFYNSFICFTKMVYFSKIAGAVAAVCLASAAVAHPGEHHDHQAIKREISARNQMASAAKRSIDSCSNSLKHRQLNARSVARRAETAAAIRKARNIKTRTLCPNSLINLSY
jgi:hypothetical protein